MSEEPTKRDLGAAPGVDLSPLDPYVDLVVHWIAESSGGVAANGLSSAIALQFDWPAPFAEAILVSVNGRRLLKSNQMSNRQLRFMLSRRGQAWLDGQSGSR